MRLRSHIKTAAIICLLAFMTVSATAAPKAVLWERWQANDPLSKISVDHGQWSRFLGIYLTPGRPGDVSTVAYSRVSASDKQRLGDYITSLEHIFFARGPALMLGLEQCFLVRCTWCKVQPG
jgi:hypothetical protein